MAMSIADRLARMKEISNDREELKGAITTDEDFIPPEDDLNPEIKKQMEEEGVQLPPRDEKGRFTKKKEEDDLSSNKEIESDEEFEEKQSQDIDDIFTKEELRAIKAKAIIDGKEVEVTADKLLEVYQKNAAADERLKNASLLQKEYENKQLELAKKEKELLELEQKRIEELQNSIKQEQIAKQKLPKKDVEAELSQAADALLQGDEKKFAELLKPLFEKDASDDIEARVAKEVERRAAEIEARAAKKASDTILQQEWEKEREKYATKRKDIVEDEYKAQLFDSYLNVAVNKLGGLNPKAWAEAERAFDDLMEKSGVSSKSKNEADSFKEEREKALQKAKKYSANGSSTVRSDAKQQEKEVIKTAEQIRLEMMQQRKSWLYPKK